VTGQSGKAADFPVRSSPPSPNRSYKALRTDQHFSWSKLSGFGSKRQFAAVLRYGRYRCNTGRSAEPASTAAPDPGDIVLRQFAADFLRFVSFMANMNCRLRRLAKELRCQ
jgi:hypothetical protein